jgi:hypothetical protein
MAGNSTLSLQCNLQLGFEGAFNSTKNEDAKLGKAQLGFTSGLLNISSQNSKL